MSFHSSLSVQKHNSCSGSVCSIFNIITSFTNFTRTWFFIFTRMRITDKLLWAQQLVGGNDNYGDAYEGMSMVRKHGMTAIKDLTRDAALSLALQFLMGWGWRWSRCQRPFQAPWQQRSQSTSLGMDQVRILQLLQNGSGEKNGKNVFLLQKFLPYLTETETHLSQILSDQLTSHWMNNVHWTLKRSNSNFYKSLNHRRGN